MVFKDITNDTETIYQLHENERAVFFMFNRGGEITFELLGKGAEAHIFVFYVGKNNDSEKLHVIQKHVAPHTTSSLLTKSVLFGASEFTYEGLIHIAKIGEHTDASQESRSLLLSPEARSFTKPSLEILASDVKCRHAATTSPLNKESVFFAQTRGLSITQATELLIHGFFNEAFDRMKKLGANTTDLENKVTASLS